MQRVVSVQVGAHTDGRTLDEHGGSDHRKPVPVEHLTRDAHGTAVILLHREQDVLPFDAVGQSGTPYQLVEDLVDRLTLGIDRHDLTRRIDPVAEHEEIAGFSFDLGNSLRQRDLVQPDRERIVLGKGRRCEEAEACAGKCRHKLD